jgi:hypothetical protein
VGTGRELSAGSFFDAHEYEATRSVGNTAARLAHVLGKVAVASTPALDL